MYKALLAATVMSVAVGSAGADVTVELERARPGTIESTGFEIDRTVDARVEAILALDPQRSGWLERMIGSWIDRGHEDAPFFVHAMLLDADSRRTVWRASYDKSRRVDSGLQELDESLRLEPGRYELLLVTRAERDGWSGPLGNDGRPSRGALDDSRVSLRLEGLSTSDVRRFEPDGRRSDALVSLGPVVSGGVQRVGIELSAAVELRVVSVIEQIDDDSPSDYGWIAEEATGEVVWSPTRRHLRGAGGAKKNRLVDESVKLEAGRYVLTYGTDDSHAVDGFNAAPPDDPFGWGITLLPGDRFDRAVFSTFEPVSPGEPVIGWIRVGDRARLRQPFRLQRDGALRITAFGEYDDDDDTFVDGARLVEPGTGRTVWRMTHANTIGAGGASKNRRFVGSVELSAGLYELHYVTDGSHSFEDWNAAAPFEPESWGVALRPGAGLDERDLVPLGDDEVAAAGGLLVRLTAIADSERARVEFRLDRPARVEVRALGEGDDGDMYDYGGIDDADGRTVWRMDYGRTSHAGGAMKNRSERAVLELAAGRYEAWFATDGSHAYGDWNAAPPDEPHEWGMTVRRLD